MKACSSDTALVLLAAGGSTRLGQPKQLFHHRGTSLLRHAALACLAARSGPVCVVLGNAADRLERELDDLPVLVATNPAWASGLASSIRTGLATVLDTAPELRAVVLTLCDQPLLTADVLRALVEVWHAAGRSIVASDYGDGHGPPALFGRRWFDALARLEGDAGARTLMRAHPDEVALVPFPGGAFDVHTPADWARLGTGPA